MNISHKSVESYKEVFNLLEKLPKSTSQKIISIDGRCASGKSTLASLISEKFNCTIFHMDDFFLPPEMRIKERLEEPGGNVHYERFYEEVLSPIKNNKPVEYRPYNCQIDEFGKSINKELKNLIIIEGVYSLHPSLQAAYDLKIFLTMNREVQLERIEKRSGKEKLQRFIDQWIPMEEKYFRTFNIEEQCDFVVDTTALR